jgi:hypothetical protein
MLSGYTGRMADLIVSASGHYRGNYSRVIIRTANTVFLHDMVIQGPGTLLTQDGVRARVALSNVTFLGDGLGRSIDLFQPSHFSMAHCHIEGHGGVYLNGDGVLVNRVYFRHNTGKNIKRTNQMTNFFQLDKVRNAPGILIADNVVKNYYGSTEVEDVFNLYNSSGTPASPGLIQRNKVYGAFYMPEKAGQQYNGSGFMFDGSGQSTSWWIAEDNEVYGHQNVGIGIAAGHDITVRRNRFISDGIPGNAMGIYHWNYYNETGFGAGNRIYDNSSMCRLAPVNGQPGPRNDWWQAQPATEWRNNVNLPDATPEPTW